MRWEHPWLLLLLIAVPFLVGLALRPSRRRPAVLWGRSGSWGGRFRGTFIHVIGYLPWAALLLALIALARPQQGVRQSETETKGVDIVLAIDISPSMAAEDFRPLNRMFVAKSTARDFVKMRPHDRLAVVGFAATAFLQCPLTLDHGALLELLDGLDIGLAEDGTAIGMGLATAVSALRMSKTPSRVVVLLTDGQNNRGSVDPLTGADLAQAYGIKVYSVLVGRGGVVPVPVVDALGVRRVQMMQMDVDEGVLREISKRTGGRFFRAQDSATLSDIYAEIDRLERAPIRAIQYREYRDLGPWLLGAAAAILALHALLASTIAARLP
jgi:Ca-activated chloride channel family protein